MVYQPLETRLARLNQHVEVVSVHYRNALANVEFYPETEKARLSEQISAEYDSFTQAVALMQQGRIVREIQDQVCSEARSWVRGNIPAAIARYSFYQISDAELVKCSQVSMEQIGVCRLQMVSALDTVAKLSANDNDPRSDTIQKIRKEFESFERALVLYGRGFSFLEIKELSGESVQARVEKKTIPETILKFAGYPLSQEEAQARNRKVAKLKAAAVRAFGEATALQKEVDPATLKDAIATWKGELAKLNLVFDLYEKGLSVAAIGELTGLNAGSWIGGEQLPVKLARACRDWVRRDFTIPTQIDSDLAYIVGALYASTRVFSVSSGMIFRSPERETIEGLRDRLQRVFATSCVDPAPEGQGHVLRVQRSLLVRGLFDMLGIADGSKDPVPPFEIIKYSDTCRAFLQGFLSFSRPAVNVDLNRFQVGRSAQPNLLKVVAARLYVEKIYPVVRENENAVALVVSARREFEALCALVPAVLTEEDRNKLAQRPKLEADPIGSYAAYERISEVLKKAYPEGVTLNFHDVLQRARIECVVDLGVKTRIAHWRKGKKPHVAQRAEALERLLGSLYPEAL